MRSSVAYVGMRGPQPGYGHGGPSVVGVVRDGRRTTLELEDDRMIEGGFEWGYESAFLRDTVARLTAEFELPGERIASWVNDRLLRASVQPAETES
jgi:hypothetical protein